MKTWVLILWSLSIQPMEAGEYQTLAACLKAGPIHVEGLRKQFGRMWWTCELAGATA